MPSSAVLVLMYPVAPLQGWRNFVAIFPIVYLIMELAVWFVGVPAFVYLHLRSKDKWYSAMILGSITGSIVELMLADRVNVAGRAILVYGLLGGMTGLMFFIFWKTIFTWKGWYQSETPT